MPRGGRRAGAGRPKGSKNKRTLALAQAMALAEQKTHGKREPLEILLDVANTPPPTLSPEQREQIAQDPMMAYEHMRLLGAWQQLIVDAAAKAARFVHPLPREQDHPGSDPWIDQLVGEYREYLIRLRDNPQDEWLGFSPADEEDLHNSKLRGLPPWERWLKRRAMREQGEESQPHQQQGLGSPS